MDRGLIFMELLIKITIVTKALIGVSFYNINNVHHDFNGTKDTN